MPSRPCDNLCGKEVEASGIGARHSLPSTKNRLRVLFCSSACENAFAKDEAHAIEDEKRKGAYVRDYKK